MRVGSRSPTETLSVSKTYLSANHKRAGLTGIGAVPNEGPLQGEPRSEQRSDGYRLSALVSAGLGCTKSQSVRSPGFALVCENHSANTRQK